MILIEALYCQDRKKKLQAVENNFTQFYGYNFTQFYGYLNVMGSIGVRGQN